jgi:hypothetical protein
MRGCTVPRVGMTGTVTPPSGEPFEARVVGRTIARVGHPPKVTVERDGIEVMDLPLSWFEVPEQ